jgi:hypothetical protein
LSDVSLCLRESKPFSVLAEGLLKVTWQEHLEVGLAIYDAGRMPLDAGFFWVARFLLESSGPGEERVQALWAREFQDRFEAVRKQHGLAEDEDWPPGQGPAEYEALNAEFEEATDRVLGEVLGEYAVKIGHPLVRQAAELYAADRLGFERRVEKGRQWLFGPPDEVMTKYLRVNGIIA